MTGGRKQAWWRRRVRAAVPAAAVLGIVAVATPTATATASTPSRVVLQGHVLVGGKPAAGARVQLLAGGAQHATALGRARTGPEGRFAIRYRAPSSADAPLYVVSDGGRAADGRVRLMSVASLAGKRPTSVYVNEQSTVAAAYSLAQFLHGTQVTGPAPGLPDAAATAANLYESRAGKVSFVLATPPNGNATQTLGTFNALADALATCTTGASSACTRLLAAARPRGASRPANTLAAMLDVARNPAQNTRSLFTIG